MQSKLKYIRLWLIVVFTFCLQVIYAQVWPGPHPLLSSSVRLNLEEHIPGQVDTFETKFGYAKTEVVYSLPIYRGKDWLTATGNTPLIGFTIQSAASLLQPQGGFLSNDNRLLRARLGGNFIYSRGLRNLYMANAQGVLSNDIKSISFSGIYINGTALWRHRQNDQFGWTLGLTYSSVYGNNKLLPIVGISFHPTKEDLITFLLPFNIQYKHSFNRSMALSITLRPNGGFYNLNYKVNDSTTIKNIIFRHHSKTLSASILYKLSYQFSIDPEVGLESKTRLSLNENKYHSTSTLFARITLRYKFGQRAHVAPILDFDPTDFTTAEPEIPEN